VAFREDPEAVREGLKGFTGYRDDKPRRRRPGSFGGDEMGLSRIIVAGRSFGKLGTDTR